MNDERIMIMRFRAERIKDIDKYILWVDTYALFPYDYESVDLCISLWDKSAKEIRFLSRKNLSITAPLPNPQWLSGTEKGNRSQASGIPFYFDTQEELQEVATVGFTWVFYYHNEHGEDNRHVIYMMESVSFDVLSNNRDYVIEKRCTSIPSILEQNNNRTRREIINDYEEVIHSCAEVFQKTSVLKRKSSRERIRAVQIYINRIKSEGNISDDEAYDISGAAFEYLLEKDMLGSTCDNVYMCIFLNRTRRLLRPVTDEMKAYLLGSS